MKHVIVSSDTQIHKLTDSEFREKKFYEVNGILFNGVTLVLSAPCWQHFSAPFEPFGTPSRALVNYYFSWRPFLSFFRHPYNFFPSTVDRLGCFIPLIFSAVQRSYFLCSQQFYEGVFMLLLREVDSAHIGYRKTLQ